MMKRNYMLLLFIFCFAIDSSGQQKDVVKLDLLKAPSSPAAQLLGFAISDIEKPTDLSSFMLSLQSATSSYSKLPNSYAIDLSPFLLMKGDTSVSISGNNSLRTTESLKVIKQTLVFSLAVRNPDSSVNNFSSKNTYGALGLKFSIVRPGFSKKNEEILNKITINQQFLLEIVKNKKTSFIETAEYRALQEERKQAVKKLQITSKSKNAEEFQDLVTKEEQTPGSDMNIIKTKLTAFDERWNEEILASTEAQSAMAQIKSLANSFDAARVGFSWDVAGGLGVNFRDKRFNNSKVYNSGIWTTMGYNFEKAGSILALGRIMFNPDEIYALDNAANTFTQDINTFDSGLRYVLSKKRFSCSLEGIYRSVLGSGVIDPSWKVIFNTDYTIAPNQKLMFSFGKNFDGTISKSNNLVAALTVLFGIGGNRL